MQGNLDPSLVFAPTEVMLDRAAEVLEAGRAAPGHIFNLGHGVMPSTDPDQLARLTDFVHEHSRALTPCAALAGSGGRLGRPRRTPLAARRAQPQRERQPDQGGHEREGQQRAEHGRGDDQRRRGARSSRR